MYFSSFFILFSFFKSNIITLLSLTGNILLKLTTPNLPLAIFNRSILDFNFKCLVLGLDNGAKYLQLFISNKTPIKGLNSLLPQLYGTLLSYCLR